MTNEEQKNLNEQGQKPVVEEIAGAEQPDERVIQANAAEEQAGTAPPSGESVEASEEQVLPLLPLRGTVVFPQTLVPLAAVVSVKDSIGPAIVNRYNMFPSAEVSGNTAPGFSSGQAITLMEQITKQELPSAMSFESFWPSASSTSS